MPGDVSWDGWQAVGKGRQDVYLGVVVDGHKRKAAVSVAGWIVSI